jgi:hypothetical protein
MGNESAMATRAEVTHKYAKPYAAASKKDRGRMLDEVVSVTGWSRDNARRRLVAAARTPPGPGPGAGHVSLSRFLCKGWSCELRVDPDG